jgi:hypothetical protein
MVSRRAALAAEVRLFTVAYEARSHPRLTISGEDSLHRCTVYFRFRKGIFDPDLAGLEEAIKFIPCLDAKRCHELMSGDAVLTVSLDQRVFENGARKILPRRDKLLGKLVRNVDRDLDDL